MSDAFEKEQFESYIELGYFSNLQLPEGFDQQKTYYAFSLNFIPFENLTTSLDKDDSHLRNLASVVLYEKDEDLEAFCKSEIKIATLSKNLTSNGITLPKLEAFEPMFTEENNQTVLKFSGLTGTHLVAPRRFSSSKETLSAIHPKMIFNTCRRVTLEVENIVKPTGNKITKQMLVNAKIAKDSIVFIDSQWMSGHWDNQYFEKYPFFTLEAAKYLVEELNVRAIGMDTGSLDEDDTKDFPVHFYLAEQNVPVLLNVDFKEWSENHSDEGSCVVVPYHPKESEAVAMVSIFLHQTKKTIRTTEAPMSKNTRWQFGAVLNSKNAKIEALKPESTEANSESRLLANTVTVKVDYSKDGVTTFTNSRKTDMRAIQSWAQGCVPVKFINDNDYDSIAEELKSVSS